MIVWHTIYVSILSLELVSTSFKERIDVFIAHYREESVCFLHFDCPSQNRPRVNFFNDFDICIHLTWDNGIKYCFLNIPFAFGKPDFTFLDLELWQIGENWEAMATREEILEEIRKLNDAIVGLETDHRSANSEALKISIDGKITAKTGLLTIEKQRLHSLEQQGKNSPHISIVLSQSSRCNPLPKFLSTSPPHPLRFGNNTR